MDSHQHQLLQFFNITRRTVKVKAREILICENLKLLVRNPKKRRLVLPLQLRRVLGLPPRLQPEADRGHFELVVGPKTSRKMTGSRSTFDA